MAHSPCFHFPLLISLSTYLEDTVSERRITERRITKRRITGRRIIERRITKRRITERRKLSNAELLNAERYWTPKTTTIQIIYSVFVVINIQYFGVTVLVHIKRKTIFPTFLYNGVGGWSTHVALYIF
jgi:hypothetical protein